MRDKARRHTAGKATGKANIMGDMCGRSRPAHCLLTCEWIGYVSQRLYLPGIPSNTGTVQLLEVKEEEVEMSGRMVGK